MITVNNLTKEFSQGGSAVRAVNDISFTIDEGAFVSIVGRSGSGKSTLLGLLGALDSPTSGSIDIDGKDIAKLRDSALIRYRRSSIGFVFQNYNLVPNLSAIENVLLPMEYNGTPNKAARKRATQLLDQVGISVEKQNRRPGKLSGGEQQRVSIARALANKPTLILADEPTGNLDTENGEKIFSLLHKLSSSENTTIVVVTHDQEIAGKTDRTFRLQDGSLLRNSKRK